MGVELKLSPQKIVDKEFAVARHGYDALEVDRFLDVLVEDYRALLQKVNELEKANESLSSSSNIYKTRLEQAEMENAVMSEKLAHISDNDSASLSNIDLLKRISKLEQALFKAGIDPTTIK